MKHKRQQLVYDLPTRLFHWVFAGLFLISFVIAKTVEDETPLFAFHSLAGLILSFVVLLRIVWGFLGSQHARFTGFALKPFDLIKYMKGILTGSQERWAGHNPASSWAAVAMMLLALGLGVTGYLMSTGPDKDMFEDVHELMANAFVVIAILHVTGVVVHTLRLGEWIGLSMLDGKKENIAPAQTIPSAYAGVGIVFIALIVSFSMYLYKNFDSTTGVLKAFGSSLQLGEGPESGENESGDDDDDD